MLWAPPGRELATRAGTGGAEQLANRSLKAPARDLSFPGWGNAQQSSTRHCAHWAACLTRNPALPAAGDSLGRNPDRATFLKQELRRILLGVSTYRISATCG